MYIQPATLPARFPNAVRFAGDRYFRTDKVGTDRITGQRIAEYESDTSARVWRSADGTVDPE